MGLGDPLQKSGENGDSSKEELIIIATIGRPVGQNGWCRVFPYGSTFEYIDPPCRVMVGTEKSYRSIVLEAVRNTPKGFQTLFKDYTTREKVDTLKNINILLKKSELPQNDPDVFYHFELEGMTVISSATSECIGSVRKVHNYPTIDALEVERKNGYTFIVPMNRDVIKEIDKSERKIVVESKILEELL